MPSEPLSYYSLKTILQHMEANLRFQVSLQIPSVRTAERAAPLKIDELTFDNMKTVVNKTEYKLGVCKKYHEDSAHVPNNTQYCNDNGGAQFNFDQYGIPDHSSDHNIMTPGDVDFGKSSRNRMAIDPDTNETRMQHLERVIERFEEIVAEARPQGEELLETTNVIVGTFRATFSRGTPLTKIESRINNLRAELVPYHCWRDRTPPPFDMHIQFTITSENGKKIQRMRYNRRLYEAQKHLNAFLFGERMFPIQVNWFHISYFMCRKVIRLPLGMRFKIKCLKTQIKLSETLTERYEALKPIFESSSFPLKCLQFVTRQHTDEDFKHPIVTSAEELVIWCNRMPDWRTVVQNLPNRSVQLKLNVWDFEEYINLIQNWLNSGRQVGTHFALRIIKEEEEMTELLELIKQRFNGAISGEKSITLPMNDSLNIKIFYDTDPNVYLQQFCNKPHWVLGMKVVRNEAA